MASHCEHILRPPALWPHRWTFCHPVGSYGMNKWWKATRRICKVGVRLENIQTSVMCNREAGPELVRGPHGMNSAAKCSQFLCWHETP